MTGRLEPLLEVSWPITAYEVDTVRSLIRAAILFGMLGLMAAVWMWLQSRWAPRTIESWAGKGIHEGLTPAQAALLIRAEPRVIVAALVAPILTAGRAEIESFDPFRLVWIDSRPDGPVEEALDRALFAEGGPDEAHELLERLYEQVDDLVAPYDGRRTAVFYRQRVGAVRERVLARGMTDEDRDWLLLDDPNELWNAAGGGEVGDQIRAVVGFAGRVSSRMFEEREILRRSHGARTGFFRYRGDLRRKGGGGRGGPTVFLSDEEHPLPGGPLGRMLTDVANELGFEARKVQHMVISLMADWLPDYRISGRRDRRPISLEFGRKEMRITLGVRDASFDVEDVADLASSVRVPDLPQRLGTLAPFDEFRVGERSLRFHARFEPDDTTAKEILERLEVLIGIADELEG